MTLRVDPLAKSWEAQLLEFGPMLEVPRELGHRFSNGVPGRGDKYFDWTETFSWGDVADALYLRAVSRLRWWNRLGMTIDDWRAGQRALFPNLQGEIWRFIGWFLAFGGGLLTGHAIWR